MMSTPFSDTAIESGAVRKVWNVSDFARRYRLDEKEEVRLVRLLGQFASEQALLTNATRSNFYG